MNERREKVTKRETERMKRVRKVSTKGAKRGG